MTYFVYILANRWNNVLYTGVTNNIERRTYEHKVKFYPRSFTAKYNCDKLVYYEEYSSIVVAIDREKQLKKYLKKWKSELIESMNPHWDDLSP